MGLLDGDGCAEEAEALCALREEEVPASIGAGAPGKVHCIVYSIVYNIVYSIVYSTTHIIVYSMVCSTVYSTA